MVIPEGVPNRGVGPCTSGPFGRRSRRRSRWVSAAVARDTARQARSHGCQSAFSPPSGRLSHGIGITPCTLPPSGASPRPAPCPLGPGAVASCSPRPSDALRRGCSRSEVIWRGDLCGVPHLVFGGPRAASAAEISMVLLILVYAAEIFTGLLTWFSWVLEPPARRRSLWCPSSWSTRQRSL